MADAAPATRSYAAFLSYSHSDRAAALALHRWLENYRIPRELVGRATHMGIIPDRFRPIFCDREDLPAANDLTEELDAVLANSGALIVLCSPAAAKSHWTELEITRFKHHHGDNRVFAAIVAGAPFASDDLHGGAGECFPPALRRRSDTGGRAEPAAADLQRDGDGLQRGRIKLLAGLLGVPLDEFVHRDARRRQRRSVLLVLALAGALVFTSSLAAFAFRSRNEALRQRAEAEGLIEFMIGDLRKKLEPMGRLGVLDAVGTRALAFYAQQDTASLDPDSLGRRARVVQLIGQIEDQRGNLDSALSNFRVAAASTGELLQRHPGSPQRIFDHAQSVYWVGYIPYRRGQLSLAEPEFERYRELAEQLVRIDSQNPDWLAELGYAYSNLGSVQYDRGRNTAAAANLSKALAFSAKVAARRPADVQAQLDLAQSYSWLSSANERLGRLPAAVALRETEIRALDRTLADDRENAPARLEMTAARTALARLALMLGRLTEAQAIARAAEESAGALVALDPTNTECSYAAASAHLARGQAELAAGDVAGAETALGAMHRHTSTLGARDRNVAKWQMIGVDERLLQAAIDGDRGDHRKSLQIARDAIDTIGALPQSHREFSDARWLLNRARLQAATELLAINDPTGAQALLAAMTPDRIVANEPEEPRMTTLLAAAAQARGSSSMPKQ